jgi:drug/metabolite transporter (DMT)-like permease
MLALGSSLFTRERLSGKVWAAVIASSVGVVLVVGEPGAGRSLMGDGLVLLSLVVCVVWMLMSKDLLDKYPVVAMTAYVHAIGTIFLAPIAIMWAGVPRLDLTAATWTSVAVLGLGCSALTYALWNWAVKQVPVARAGLVVNIEPLVGVALGALVLGEPVGSHAFAGGALIVGSAFLAGTR